MLTNGTGFSKSISEQLSPLASASRPASVVFKCPFSIPEFFVGRSPETMAALHNV
jgi:hypothetical protein